VNAPGLLTLGQTLGVIRTAGYGPLARNSELALSIAGAESNVAIGMRRLGIPATWIGHVGADAIGDLVLRELQAEGVTVAATRDPTRPTALLLGERRTSDRTRIWYYRRDAAGAGLSPDDLHPDLFATASVLHVTGITACLGAGPADAVRTAIGRARQAGLTVSFDLNHRLALADADTFAATVRPLLAEIDLVFATSDEATVLTKETDPVRMAGALRDLGPATAVLKFGAKGSLLCSSDRLLRQPAVAVTAIDPVGAGDAFAAGFLAALLTGATPEQQLGQAAAVAGIAVATRGDWEGLPTAAELLTLTGPTDISR
jgi:2-dehydro-3-deoxygluconokinase